MMRKFLSLLLVVVMLFSSSGTVFATHWTDAYKPLRHDNIYIPQQAPFIDWSSIPKHQWGREVINYDGASPWARDAIKDAFNGGFLDFIVMADTMSYEPSIATDFPNGQTNTLAGRYVYEEEGVMYIDRSAFAKKSDFTQPITRREFAQLAVMWVTHMTGEKPLDLITRFLKWKPEYFGDTVRYLDSMISYAYYYGIITPTGNDGVGTLRLYGEELRLDWDVENQYLSPDSILTREQAATMMLRTINFVNLMGHVDDTPREYRPSLGVHPGFAYTTPVYYEDEYRMDMSEVHKKVQAKSNTPDQGFADINTAGTWAIDAINYCKANNIINGTSNNTFSPKANYTIEQAIAAFNNITPKREVKVVEPVEPVKTVRENRVMSYDINGTRYDRVDSVAIDTDEIVNVCQIGIFLKMDWLEWHRDGIHFVTPEQAAQLLDAEVKVIGDTIYVTK